MGEPRFSTRTAWPRDTNAITERLRALRADGTPLLDLTVSNPTRVGLHAAPTRLPHADHYDPDPRGLPAARDAVAAYYARRGLDVDPDDILLTASTSEAYAHLLRLFVEPGDEVLVPTPGYPLFDFLLALADARPRRYRHTWAGAWHLDDPLPVEGARLFLSVSPNNPTGHALVGAERARVEAQLAAANLPWVSDEVFADYAPTPHRELSALSAEPTLDRVILGGLSKAAGLPQLKVAWMVLAGPHRQELRARLELILDTYLSVGTPVMEALPEILLAAETFQDILRARIQQNLRTLLVETQGRPLWPRPWLGGWSVLVDVPRTMTDEAWVLALLDEARVVVQPGWFYDLEAPGTWVLSLIGPPDEFAEGLERILATIERAL